MLLRIKTSIKSHKKAANSHFINKHGFLNIRIGHVNTALLINASLHISH